MGELEKMTKKIVKISVFLTIVVSILLAILFKSLTIFLGVWIGCFVAIMGYFMISKFTCSVSCDEDEAKKQGRYNYTLRYGFYGVSFLVATLLGVPVLSLLAGYMCHKGALIIYALKEGGR